ncbi:MAG: Glyoxalase/bleomycin resistance protein/dioxygenase [Myxococcales bacterium]|nr:Glyoxalase/bleomycin resistance protein/dioxygenase [Myxococcales bacterium]
MAVLEKMIGFVTTNDVQKARAFYGGVLGFRLTSEDDFAVVFDANGTMLRVAKGRGDFKPAQGTVLGWEVGDIHAAIRELTASGVRFEQFNLPFMKQDEDGVWTPPNGDQVAWFKDPDGNTLSLSHHRR